MKKELDPTAVIITGAFNVHEQKRNLFNLALFAGVAVAERCYSGATKGLYASLGRLAWVSHLVVPPKLGLSKPDETYEATAAVVTHKIEKYADDKVTLLGHSMGGVVAARLAHDRPDLVKNVVTIGSPFHGITHSLFRQDQLTENTRLIRQQREALDGQAPSLHFIASSADLLVPVYSALPNMPDSDYTVITQNAPNHINMVQHPEVLDICREVIHG